jgi:hypothetical protein
MGSGLGYLFERLGQCCGLGPRGLRRRWRRGLLGRRRNVLRFLNGEENACRHACDPAQPYDGYSDTKGNAKACSHRTINLSQGLPIGDGGPIVKQPYQGPGSES